MAIVIVFLVPVVTIFGWEGAVGENINWIRLKTPKHAKVATPEIIPCFNVYFNLLFTKWTSLCSEEDLRLETETMNSLGNRLLR